MRAFCVIFSLFGIALVTWGVIRAFDESRRSPGVSIDVSRQVLGIVRSGDLRRVKFVVANNTNSSCKLVGISGAGVCNSHGCIRLLNGIPIEIASNATHDLEFEVSFHDPGSYTAPLTLFINVQNTLQMIQLVVYAEVLAVDVSQN